MIYRENGQFKTSYKADSQVFPITQDRVVSFVWANLGGCWGIASQEVNHVQ